MKPCRQDNISSKPYRFKKWTNKNYAVFNSIGREISIGVLSTDVSSRIGAKDSCHSKGIFLLTNKNSCEEAPEDEPDALETGIQQIPNPVISVSESDEQGGSISNDRILPCLPFSYQIIFTEQNAGDFSYLTSYLYSLINHNFNSNTL